MEMTVKTKKVIQPRKRAKAAAVKTTAKKVANREPGGLRAHIDQAIKSGQYMVAVWRVEGGMCHMVRITEQFPMGDFQSAADLLTADLAKERGISAK